ncbi:hypothetical protein [Niveispirillum fermenti]|uniref:hypothetical protein n=1 Tax=Niveispirillum fermenti TaxID=1233113 RepID=UPI003A83EF30
MRALKIILILGAVIIAAGFAFLGYEVYKRSTDPSHPRKFADRFGTAAPKPADVPVAPHPAGASAQAPLPGAPVRAPLPTTPAVLPAGAALLPGIAAIDGRLAVQVRLSDGRTQVLLIDPATGENGALLTTLP